MFLDFFKSFLLNCGAVFLTVIFLLNVKLALLCGKAKVPSSPGLDKDLDLQ